MPSNLKQIAEDIELSKLVKDYLKGIEELIIVPHLDLHSIPFSAFPLDSGKTLGESLRLRIVPSAQILEFCQQRGTASRSNYGTVEDADNTLPLGAFEGEKIAQIHSIPSDNRLRGKEEATVENYRQLIKRVQVLHSYHHASSRLDKPLESQLLLGDGAIKLGEIMSPSWRVPSLVEVFLSCCETNLTFAQLTDDPLTIATVFLCAGARTVISTLWSVEELATALFSIFYYQLRQDNNDPCTALQKAQLQLRNLTSKELEDKYYGELDKYLQQQLRQAQTERKKLRQILQTLTENTEEYNKIDAQLKELNNIGNQIYKSIEYLKQYCQQEKPFAHPFYWAGFICQGLR
jgi:CHAT domain-containing protein